VKTMRTTHGANFWLLLSVAIMLLLQFGLAFGQEEVSYTPSDTDISMKVLKDIIGDWTGSEGLNSISPLFAGAMHAFNAGVLVFATAIFAYTAIVGTLQSAHDGQLLGKQWSTVWVPIRFTGGIAMLIPTASGLCLAQYGMLWLLGHGVGLASHITHNSAANYVALMGNVVSVRMMNSSSIEQATIAILGNELCVAALNKQLDPGVRKYGMSVLHKDGTVVPIGDASTYFNASSPPLGARIQWGGLPDQGTGKPANACGETLAMKSELFEDNFDEMVRYGQSNGIVAMAHKLRPLAEKAMNYGGEGDMTFISKQEVAGFVREAALAYQTTVGGMIGSNIAEQTAEWATQVVDTAEEGGWFTLGTWYFQLNRLNGKLNELANDIPTVDLFKKQAVWDENSALNGIEEADIRSIGSVIGFAGDYFSEQPIPNNKLLADKKVGAGGSMDGPVSSVIHNMTNSLFGVGSSVDTGVIIKDSALYFGYDPLQSAPAIAQLKNVGDSIINGVYAVAGLSAAIAVTDLMPASGAMKKGKDIVSKLMPSVVDGEAAGAMLGAFAGTLMSSTALMLMVIGIVLAFWLPMLPFINWVGGIVGWVISVLEMLVATPIWVAAHLHPEGEGMASRHAASGYMIILELLLRPVLMVFGFIIAVIIVDPLLNVISWMYFPAFSSATVDAASGPITLLMKIIIYVVICWMTVNFAFKAISTVPSGVMKWIGGMPGQNSEMAEGIGENSRMAVVSGVHQVQGAARAAHGAGMSKVAELREKRMRESMASGVQSNK